MICAKCGMEMYPDDDRRNGMTILACLFCGNRVYDGYPRRRGQTAQNRWEREETIWCRVDWTLRDPAGLPGKGRGHGPDRMQGGPGHG